MWFLWWVWPIHQCQINPCRLSGLFFGAIISFKACSNCEVLNMCSKLLGGGGATFVQLCKTVAPDLPTP